MAERTGIEWTDSTWNPWIGCHPVSAGCEHCYMARDRRRWGKDPGVVVRSKTTFRDPLRWKEPRRIFTCSYSDFFIAEADAWRAEAWEIIRATPQHTYQILTKRPERIRSCLPPDWPGAYRHVWLGVTVEQAINRHRILTLMLATQIAGGIFVSAEPLLGPLNLASYEADIGWLIVGGETGPGRRAPETGWVMDLADWAAEHQIPYFFKRWGDRRDRERARSYERRELPGPKREAG